MGRYCFADYLYMFQNFRGVHIYTWILTYKNILAVEFNHFYVPPFSKAGHIALLLSVCLFVGWSVSRFTNSFCSFYLQRLHVSKWYLVNRFIIIRSRSNLYNQVIFDRVLMLGHKKFPIICCCSAFSLQRLHAVMNFCIQIFHNTI